MGFDIVCSQHKKKLNEEDTGGGVLHGILCET